ncbi:MAG: metalloregulator ArsR/SmtB family transcription factor [Candidatus Nanoarchaeia archaeon]|nr:metalloregulator ArsR/SmtB family transcription factor [Candidatus Nanoarchaeia archaeon]MDD5588419.1 metalloregulator ArsR/SmtB family transcription factor [Candidatus Nanoarchaeia archaeon]
MKFLSYNSFFMNFANKTKLNIILFLKEGPLSVNDIVKKTGMEQSKVSHNLTRLTKCKILTVEQKGKQRIYSLNKKTVVPLLNLVKNHIRQNCPMNCGECEC